MTRQVTTLTAGWRKWISASFIVIFLLFFLFVGRLCYCPTYYIELSCLGLVPLLCGPRLYRWLGCGVLAIGLLRALGEQEARAYQSRQVEQTRINADLRTIKAQLKLYEDSNGFYPTTNQGLRALVTRPETGPVPERWSQLFKMVPTDPWKHPYIYRCPGSKHPDSYDLFSAGTDGRPDTADDDWGD